MESHPHILVIRLTAIGDVVLTLPVISALRQNFPAAKISFLTTQENASLLRGFNDVDESIRIDRAVFHGGNPIRMAGELIRLVCRLRAGKFSLVVDLQDNGESAWLTWLTGTRQRWGVIHKPSRRWAYTRTINRRRDLHAAEIQLELLQHCGLKTDKIHNVFTLPAGALTAAKEFLRANKLVVEKPTLFIQPFTSSVVKNWPLENYLAVARHWQARGWQIVFSGGPADRTALEPARASGFIVSAGVPLLVTGGLMQLATLIVGGDTGALHLAVALGKRVVMLMRHNRPGRAYPFRHEEWSLMPPENLGIETISLSQVITVSEQALA